MNRNFIFFVEHTENKHLVIDKNYDFIKKALYKEFGRESNLDRVVRVGVSEEVAFALRPE